MESQPRRNNCPRRKSRKHRPHRADTRFDLGLLILALFPHHRRLWVSSSHAQASLVTCGLCCVATALSVPELRSALRHGAPRWRTAGRSDGREVVQRPGNSIASLANNLASSPAFLILCPYWIWARVAQFRPHRDAVRGKTGLRSLRSTTRLHSPSHLATLLPCTGSIRPGPIVR